MIEHLRIAKQVDPTHVRICETVEKIRDFFIKQVVLRLENEVLGKLTQQYETVEKMIKENKLKEARPLIEKLCSELPRSSEAAYLNGFYDYMVSIAFGASRFF